MGTVTTLAGCLPAEPCTTGFPWPDGLSIGSSAAILGRMTAQLEISADSSMLYFTDSTANRIGRIPEELRALMTHTPIQEQMHTIESDLIYQ